MIVRLVIAALLAVLGVVWIGQGLGYIGGSFMTSDVRWAVIGLGCVAAAAALVWSARRR